MNNRYIFRSVIIIVLLLLALKVEYSYCYNPLNTPVGKDIIFNKALFLSNTGRNDEALQEYRRIADENKGTEIGANALLRLASSQKENDCFATYNEIIATYPDSRYWFIAKLFIIIRKYNISTEYKKILEEEDVIVKSIGGLSVFDFLNERYEKFNRKNVPEQYRNDLADYYVTKISFYESPTINKTMKIDPQKTIRMLIFVRENFPEYNLGDTMRLIRSNVKELHNYSGNLPDDTTPPIIWPIHPHPGSSAGRRRPWIKFKAYDGDISQSQIDLPKLVFTLNGQDLTKDMTVQSIIDRSGHFSMKNPTKKAFELLTIKYRPPYPLTDGRHTVYIKVPDRRGHVTEKTWNFDVKPGTSHPDDSLPDEHTTDED